MFFNFIILYINKNKQTKRLFFLLISLISDQAKPHQDSSLCWELVLGLKLNVRNGQNQARKVESSYVETTQYSRCDRPAALLEPNTAFIPYLCQIEGQGAGDCFHFTYLYCLSADHQDRNLFAGCPRRRPGKRGWGHPGCPWWPAYRPSVQSSRQGNISPSAPRTCPGWPRHPIHLEISCTPAPGTLLDEDRKRRAAMLKSDTGSSYLNSTKALMWLYL